MRIKILFLVILFIYPACFKGVDWSVWKEVQGDGFEIEIHSKDISDIPYTDVELSDTAEEIQDVSVEDISAADDGLLPDEYTEDIIHEDFLADIHEDYIEDSPPEELLAEIVEEITDDGFDGNEEIMEDEEISEEEIFETSEISDILETLETSDMEIIQPGLILEGKGILCSSFVYETVDFKIISRMCPSVFSGESKNSDYTLKSRRLYVKSKGQ
jgi:hypothetical protein